MAPAWSWILSYRTRLSEGRARHVRNPTDFGLKSVEYERGIAFSLETRAYPSLELIVALARVVGFQDVATAQGKCKVLDMFLYTSSC